MTVSCPECSSGQEQLGIIHGEDRGGQAPQNRFLFKKKVGATRQKKKGCHAKSDKNLKSVGEKLTVG